MQSLDYIYRYILDIFWTLTLKAQNVFDVKMLLCSGKINIKNIVLFKNVGNVFHVTCEQKKLIKLLVIRDTQIN